MSLAMPLVELADRCVTVGGPFSSATRRLVSRLGRRPAHEVRLVPTTSATLEDNAATGWRELADVDFILHVEEDFAFLAKVSLRAMSNELESEAEAGEVLLTRQRWYRAEFGYPSVTEFLCATESSHRVPTGGLIVDGYWSFNPSLYRARLVADWLTQSDPRGDEDFELRFRRFTRERSLSVYVPTSRDTPQVWHVGALTTTRARTAHGRNGRALLYVIVHAKRCGLVVQQLMVRRLTSRLRRA